MKKKEFKALRVLSWTDFCTDVSANRGGYCIFL